MPPSANFVSLETAKPIEAKVHVEPSWDGETRVCSNGSGHMNNMADMPLYGKNLKKSSSPEPKCRWPWKMVCTIGYSSTTKFVQIMTLGWPWLISRQGQIWSLMLLYGKKVNTGFFFRNYCSLWYQGWLMQSTKWVHQSIWISKVKVIHWPWSKVTQIQHFQP